MTGFIGAASAEVALSASGAAIVSAANRAPVSLDLMFISQSPCRFRTARGPYQRSVLTPVFRKDENTQTRYCFRDHCHDMSRGFALSQSATAMKRERTHARRTKDECM